VVRLEVLLFAGCLDSPHGPDALSSTFEESLREIADFKEPKSAPAGVPSMLDSLEVKVLYPT